jgi:hypothetical protein
MVNAKDLGLRREGSGHAAGCLANGCRSGRLGAFLGHIDRCAMYDLLNKHPSVWWGLTGHAAEIGAITIEREFHAGRLKGWNKVCPVLKLEAWKCKRDELYGRTADAREQISLFLVAKPLDDSTETVDFVRQDNDHGERRNDVRKANDPVTVARD